MVDSVDSVDCVDCVDSVDCLTTKVVVIVQPRARVHREGRAVLVRELGCCLKCSGPKQETIQTKIQLGINFVLLNILVLINLINPVGLIPHH